MSDAVSQRVLGRIEETTRERIAFLQDLVRIPSPEGEGDRIIQFVSDRMRDIGADRVDMFYPDLDELRHHPGYSPVHPEHSSTPGGEAPAVVATFQGTGGGRSLMFYGHMETGTPAWEPSAVARMVFDPWGGEVANGRLYGRGAYNMKSGNAAGLMALWCIRSCGIRLPGEILFNFNSDEDVGSNGALGSILRGYTADAGINPEPTSLWIAPATGGPLWFRVEVEGRSGFAGWAGGVNPIDKALKLYGAIEAYARHRKETARHPLFDDLPNPAPLSVGVFRAGNWPSNIPQVAVLEGRIGCLPGEDLEAIRREFEDRLLGVAEKDEWMRSVRPRILWTAQWEPCETSVKHPIVRISASVYRSLTGEEPVISGKTAGNDMTKIVTYGRVPSVNWGPRGGPFGPKRGASLDQPEQSFDEFVELDSYHQLTRLFALTILRWCTITEEP